MLGTICKKGLPSRLLIAIGIFFGCFFNYMLRVNMSINIIAMVQSHSVNNNVVHIPECILLNGNKTQLEHSQEFSSSPDYGMRYEWDAKEQGYILASYFWGTIVTSIPGGFLAERFGPTKTVGIATALGAIITILTPLAATWGWIAVLALRILLGLTAGVIYPAMHSLISRWVPPDEKGKFSGALFGGTLGTVVTWPLSGSIIEQWGWKWAFCVQGCLALVFCCLWILLISDSPETHKRISEEEKNYILKSLGDVGKVKATPPYFQMALSIPFWALAVLHFGNLWGLYLLLTAGPKYMSEVLGFNIGHSGILAALPYLARSLAAFLFGYIGDKIHEKNWLTTTATRKSFVLFSHFLPGLLLFAILLVGCDVTWCVILITVSLGFNGASTITNIQNNQDLSPNFAGSIYGIINCIGSTTGFFTPMITGHITEDNNGLEEWHTIFTIGASVYLVTGIIYCIFGSGERQPWNEVKRESKGGVDNPVFDEPSITTEKAVVTIENTKV
ncbi:hypothetical protein FQA39_LY10209 [Lamprigera yunnana]|nr:hypothetical protein FQA39_LY10209 [Lamprigera yunnana]